MRSLRYLSLPAVVLVASLSHPASATPIDFNTLPGTYGSTFTSYTENGFTIATKAGKFYVDPAGVNPAFGNPAPDIFSDDSLSGQFSESLILTKAGGGSFTLTSFDLLGYNANPDYDITGFSGTMQVYNLVGSGFTLPNTMANLETFDPGVDGVSVTSVVIAFNDTGKDPLDLAGIDLDNFVLNGTPVVTPPTVPEPGSLLLLGTGVLSMGGLMRRRQRR